MMRISRSGLLLASTPGLSACMPTAASRDGARPRRNDSMEDDTIFPPDGILDVLVIGAGQAGLATAAALQRHGRAVVLVDRCARVGDSWRARYDSLVLFTPRRYSSLPGLPLDGDPDAFPTKDEIADYLERYRARHALRVLSSIRIVRLRRRAGLFAASTDTGRVLLARAVVIATGPFQQPVIPAAAACLPPRVAQLTVDTYRNPAGLAGKRVLVAGDGASGRQIARELAQAASVTLATGKPRRILPDRLLGRSIFWWLDMLRLTRLSADTRIGRRMRELDAFPGKHLALAELRRLGIAVVGRLCSFAGDEASFACGATARVDAVIWAVGYREDDSWVDIPGACAPGGGLIFRRGSTPVPGLHVVGRSWQTSRGSALLLGVARDADEVARDVQRHLEASAAAARITSGRMPRAGAARP